MLPTRRTAALAVLSVLVLPSALVACSSDEADDEAPDTAPGAAEIGGDPQETDAVDEEMDEQDAADPDPDAD